MKAVGKHIIVKLFYAQAKGSIYLPEKARQEGADFYGEVVSVGDAVSFRDELNVGDKVLFYRNEGRKMVVDGEEFLRLKEMHVLGKLVG